MYICLNQFPTYQFWTIPFLFLVIIKLVTEGQNFILIWKFSDWTNWYERIWCLNAESLLFWNISKIIKSYDLRKVLLAFQYNHHLIFNLFWNIIRVSSYGLSSPFVNNIIISLSEQRHWNHPYTCTYEFFLFMREVENEIKSTQWR